MLKFIRLKGMQLPANNQYIERKRHATNRDQSDDVLSQYSSIFVLQPLQSWPQSWLSVVHSLHPAQYRGVHQLTELFEVKFFILIVVYLFTQHFYFVVRRIQATA